MYGEGNAGNPAVFLFVASMVGIIVVCLVVGIVITLVVDRPGRPIGRRRRR